MPTRGAVADSTRKLKDYVIYLVRRQSRWTTGGFVIVAAALVIKWAAIPNSKTVSSAVLAASLAALALHETLEFWARYRFGERASVRQMTAVEIGEESPLGFDKLRPSEMQREMGFEGHYSGADSVFASTVLDTTLLSQDWSIEIDTHKPKKVAALVRKHRAHSLAYLTTQFHRSRVNGALLVNEDKLCLGDELRDGGTVLCHAGDYFDSLCTNEACTAVMSHGNHTSRPYHDHPLFPVARDAAGYFLEDLHEADVNNHIGVSTLAITSDRHLILWQQTKRNVQGPGKIVATGSGSCDYADLDAGSLRRTVVGAMERELREECIARVPKAAGANGLVVHTSVIGFFRWLQRGGKPEFIGVSRLALPLASLRWDGFEVTGIVGETTGGSKVKLKNAFAVRTLGDLPAAIAEIRQTFSGGADLKPVALTLPLRRILDVLMSMHANAPDALHQVLYGEPRQPAGTAGSADAATVAA